MFEFLIIYFIVISLISVLITIKDKISAIKHKNRVKENTLFFFAIIGGGFPMYLTMVSIGHKTRHKKFMIGLPFIISFQCILLVVILNLVKQYG